MSAPTILPTANTLSGLRGQFWPDEGAVIRREDIARVADPRILKLVPRGEMASVDMGEPRRVTYMSDKAALAVLAAHDGADEQVMGFVGVLRERCGDRAAEAIVYRAGNLLRELETRTLGLSVPMQDARVIVMDNLTSDQVAQVVRIKDRFDRGAALLADLYNAIPGGGNNE